MIRVMRLSVGCKGRSCFRHAFSIKSSVFQAKSLAYQTLFFVVMYQTKGNRFN